MPGLMSASPPLTEPGARSDTRRCIDLHKHVLVRQAGNAYQGPGWRAFLTENTVRLSVQLVLIGHVREIDRELDDIVPVGAGGGEHGADIFVSPFQLPSEAAAHPLPFLFGHMWVIVIDRNWSAARKEYEPASLDRVGGREGHIVFGLGDLGMNGCDLHAGVP